MVLFVLCVLLAQSAPTKKIDNVDSEMAHLAKAVILLKTSELETSRLIEVVSRNK